jgi:hypothetical protein
MRKLILSAAMAALLAPFAATSASAQPYGWGNRGGYDNRVQREVRECSRELRRADSRREYQRERRECNREIREARRDSRRDWRSDRYDRYDRYDRRDRYSYRGW